MGSWGQKGKFFNSILLLKAAFLCFHFQNLFKKKIHFVPTKKLVYIKVSCCFLKYNLLGQNRLTLRFLNVSVRANAPWGTFCYIYFVVKSRPSISVTPATPSFCDYARRNSWNSISSISHVMSTNLLQVGTNHPYPCCFTISELEAKKLSDFEDMQ